jgi:FG-GAP repeat
MRSWSKMKAALPIGGAIVGLLSAMVVMPSPVAHARPISVVSNQSGSWATRARMLLAHGKRGANGIRPEFEAGTGDDELGSSVAVSGDVVMVGATGVNNNAGAVYVYLHRRGSWSLGAILTAPRSVPANEFGFAIAMSGNTALIGAGGSAYVYVGAGTRWSLQATLADPGSHNRFYGVAVALSGSIALVGSPVQPPFRSSRGKAYFFHRTGTKWHLQASVSNPLNEFDSFGDDVALSGSTAAIGALESNAFLDQEVYLYKRTGTGWSLRTKLSLGIPGLDDQQLAVSGTTVIVGDPYGDCVFAYVPSGTGWKLQATLNDPGKNPDDYFGTTIVFNGATVAIINGPSPAAPKVYSYRLSGKTWRLQSAFTAPNGIYFGASAAIAAGTVIFGAVGADQAYVYDQQGNSWHRQAILADPRDRAGNSTGAAVAIEGTTAVVGAYEADGFGAAFVYDKSRGKWRKEATITPPKDDAPFFFGAAVAISGSTIVVGSVPAVLQDGMAFIYVRSGNRWRLQAALRLIETGSSDNGISVAISGSTAIFGDGRVAYIYTRSGTRWHEQANLPDPGTRSRDGFSYSVALSGGTAVVGAPQEFSNDLGAVYIYTRDGRSWHLQASLADASRQPNDGFGTSVALTGNDLVVGAPGVSDYAGAAYFYGRSGSRWRLQAKETVSRKADVAGGFGGSVAATGNGRSVVAIIGGASVSGLALTATRCGSAFEFARPKTHWRELARILDPQCSSYDEFGYAVAVSGTTSVIGAPGAHGDGGTAFIQTVVKP